MKFAEQTQFFEMTAFMDVIARLMDAVANQMRNRWVCFYRAGFVFALCGFIRADLSLGSVSTLDTSATAPSQGRLQFPHVPGQCRGPRHSSP